MPFSFSRYLTFVLTLCSCRKNGLIRKIGLISKLNLSSQPCKETIAMQMLPNISRSKSSIEYNNRNILLQKRGREVSSRPLSFLKKALYEVKASCL